MKLCCTINRKSIQSIIYYELSIFILFFLDEAANDKSKEIIRAKCMQYLDRADKLKKLIADDKKKPVKVTHMGNTNM